MRRILRIILIFTSISSISYTQEPNQNTDLDPFLNYKFPTNIGIIEFFNDNIEFAFTVKLSQALTVNPLSQKKFNIFPYATLEAIKTTIGIRNIKELNEKTFNSLRSKLSIEFLIYGVLIDSTRISFQLIRTSDGKYFFNDIFTGSKDEIIDKIIQRLTVGKIEVTQDTKMILVEGGVYNMGYFGNQNIDSSLIDPDEIPTHEVHLQRFYMDKYEVTVGEYKKYCETSNKKMPEPPAWGWLDNNPIVNISWEDAKAYAEWSGKRLPTEAEWEFAARGGNKSERFDYSGSNGFNDIAWFYPNSNNRTHPVGEKKANELGIFDMSGNVWEWCNDNFDFYKPLTKNSNYRPSKIIRGGSYNDYQRSLRVYNRSRYFPLSKSYDIGFRCAKDVEK